MNVIHLISGGDTGGAKTHVHTLLQGLNQSIRADLVCFTDGLFVRQARDLGIPTDVIAGSNPLAALKQLKEKIRAGGYDIIHCHGARGNLMGALLARSCGIPVVTTVHSDPKLDYLGRPAAQLTFGTLNNWALHRIPYHIGVSTPMTKLLIDEGIAKRKPFTIYNGVSFENPYVHTDRVAYLRSIGVQAEEDSVVIGIAARLNPVKDISTLIRGFAAAYAQCPRLRLVIAGDGEEREMLTALTKELGVEQQVTFAGWIEGGMDRFYAAMDINTLTSLSEGSPYALPEGARYKLATVATRVGGIPDFLDHEETGYLFTPGDWETLGKYFALLGNDDDLRRSMGQRLYDKASRDFSLDMTVNTQLGIYREILADQQAKSGRKGALICGAYGLGNSGDDAILQAILQQVRTLVPNEDITVLSRNPKETAAAHGVRALHMFNLPGFLRAARRAALYINGGGNLIQDVTSRRSLWYYLYTLWAAKRKGCKVLMYGCGIGPIVHKENISLTRKILNRNVDVITLRDPDSRKDLEEAGITGPEILLTADPALCLPRASDADIDAVLQQAGIPLEGRYLCFALRQWKGFAEKAPLFTAAARYAYEKHGLTPVFLSVEHRQDPAANRLAVEGLDIPHYHLDNPGPVGTIIGLLSRMEGVVSMRLHALIFAAGQGTPLAGVVYDPKVSAFLRYIGQDLFDELDSLTEQGLCAMIDQLAARRNSPEEQTAAVERLRQLEQGNLEAARKLLNL